MEHTRSKTAVPRLVRECTLPLTGKALVDRIITDLAILDVEAGTFRVVELAPGADPENCRTAHRRSAALAKDGAKGPRSSAASALERQTWSLCSTRQPPVH
jgi:acyl CoA:acetate/3-ketoacid CoA transferase beta subunit